MSDFDYGNARLHAMKSRLLPRQTLEELAGIGSFSSLINALTKTGYQEAIEMALVQFTGMEALNRARHADLVNTIGKVRRFYQGKAADLVSWVLCRYDVDNVKTILRGLSQHVPADEILAGTIPVGQLLAADLARLIRSANPRDAIDLLATWRIPLSQSLLALRAERPGAGLFEMELALEGWYYRAAMRAADDQGSAALRAVLRLDMDVKNILTALRLVGLTEAAAFLRQRFNADDARPLFVGSGNISLELLLEVAAQSSIRRAVNKLDGTPFGSMLTGALGQYAATGRLSEFEYFLAKRQLRYASSLLFSDPLGIGVMVGYLALKTVETNNLHRIAQGVDMNEDPDLIRAELFFVDAS
jgi:V/A-type H+-transporting ATPase subunit C